MSTQLRPGGEHDDDVAARLAASFERETRRAQADLEGWRLDAVALDRRRGPHGGAPVARMGLAVAALAVLAAGAMLVVGGRPSPSPVVSPLAAAPSPSPAMSAAPTTADGSQVPIPSFGTPVPIMPGHETFPPTYVGEPIYAVGGPAEAQVAKQRDDTPFYISGWLSPLQPGACFPTSTPTMAPGRVDFDPCVRIRLFARPDGGSELSVLVGLTTQAFSGLADTTRLEATMVQRILLRVHVHDPACTIPACGQSPVLEEMVVTDAPILNPALLTAVPPAKIVSQDVAIANGRDYASEQVNGVAPTSSLDPSKLPILLSASLGTAAVLGDNNVQTDPLTTWEWRVVFVSPDGLQTITVWEDATTGASDHQGSSSALYVGQ